MTEPNRPPALSFHPRRLARWALMVPLAILSWVLWQLLMARLFFNGQFQGGLSWVEGTAEAVFVLVASLIAPARKRQVAGVALAFFMLRNIATTIFAAGLVAPGDAAITIGMAAAAAAVVWLATTRRQTKTPPG